VKLIKPAKKGGNALVSNPPAVIESKIRNTNAIKYLLRILNVKPLVNGLPSGKKATIAMKGMIINHCKIPMLSKEIEMPG
jgi:hypothetical protein